MVQGFCGEFMFITIDRYCELWNKGQECLSCDINATFKAQRDGEEDVVARLEPGVVADALKIAIEVEPLYRLHVTITGGTILGKYRGQTELRWKHRFDPPFPGTGTRTDNLLCCLHDFEYYHGTDILSKKRQEEIIAAGRKCTA